VLCSTVLYRYTPKSDKPSELNCLTSTTSIQCGLNSTATKVSHIHLQNDLCEASAPKIIYHQTKHLQNRIVFVNKRTSESHTTNSEIGFAASPRIE